MKSNFDFLKGQWAPFFDTAYEAEQKVYTTPRECAVLCRISLEQFINWMYDHDGDLNVPTDKKLSNLIHEPSFRNVITLESIFREINYIRRLGNEAAHTGKKIKPEEVIGSVKYLYRFANYIVKYYSTEDFGPSAFDESLVPVSAPTDMPLTQVQSVVEDQEKKLPPVLRFVSPELLNDSQKERISDRIKKTNDFKKRHHDFTAPAEVMSEYETRKRYIDLLLNEAGWELKDKRDLEYPVDGMPNTSEGGYVDYVLWGDDGLPLGLVEAKRTMIDSRQGQQQAVLYADCLEKKFGLRPVIFFSNGFEHSIWDDRMYPPRNVQGFFTKEELRVLINRRTSKKNLSVQTVNKEIVERYYQQEAIKRLTKAFDGGFRKGLFVMATGSGKTRLAAAITELLTKANWAKRILFLADRTALVTQAKGAFNTFLPQLNAIDLTKEESDETARVVFSTYQTMTNRIDGEWSEGNRFYGVGHFDVIFIDEAHRSVYNKYGDIFRYLDGLLIGLTATPKDEVDKNTYELFDLDNHDPTYAYELGTAIDDGWLVKPIGVEVPLRFPREGIKYKDLTDEEKREYEEKFGDPTAGAPDQIGSEALNSWLFNTDTVDKVLNHLMTNGIKVEGGDKLGKTIIFAKNHEHALFIEERFNKQYPMYKGAFLRVIDYRTAYADDLIEKFKDPKGDPQIAVSVDMLDTGIDVPEIVNLVFFKPVYSSTKYWQMIGRGTRLCKDLFGPGLDKECFNVFDYCENFAFFDHHPDGVQQASVIPLSQRIYNIKLDIPFQLSGLSEPDQFQKTYREHLLNEAHNAIASLDIQSFRVRKNLRIVEAFKERERWNVLTIDDVKLIKKELSPLIVDIDEDETAKRFDLLNLNLQFAFLNNDTAQLNYAARIRNMATQLLQKTTIPSVASKIDYIKAITKDEFWTGIALGEIERIRIELRDLIKFLDRSERSTVYTTFGDHFNAEEKVWDIVPSFTKMEGYRRRVERFIRENESHITIHKLKNNQPITDLDIQALEDIMFSEDKLGNKKQFEDAYGPQPLGVFIRSLIGLDKGAAKLAFNDFLANGNLTADQIRFIDTIINYLTENGIVEKESLYEPPFTDLNELGVDGIFETSERQNVFSILEKIKGRALVG